jgi:hypothetical protein
MKKLLLILFCLPMIGFGQTDDVLKLQNDIDNINYRMEKHSTQYYTGVKVFLIGVGVTAAGAVLAVNPFTYLGGATVLVGNIIMINSHKWFKRKNKQFYNGLEIPTIKDNPSKINKIKKRTNQLKELLRKGSISKQEYDDAIKILNEIKTID